MAAATLAAFVLAAGAVTFAGTPVTRTDSAATPVTTTATQTTTETQAAAAPSATAQTAQPAAAVSTGTS